MSGAIHIFLAESLLIPTGFVTAVFLARKLGPSDYGLFALLSQFIVWIEFLLISGLENTTIKFISDSDDWKPVANTMYVIYLILGAGVAVIFYYLSEPIAHLLKEPKVIIYLQLFMIDIPLIALAQCSRHILVGLGLYRYNALMRSSYWFSRLFFIILFVSVVGPLKGAILGIIGASSIDAILGFFLVRPAVTSRSFTAIRKFRNFLLPLHFSEICKCLIGQELFVLKALGVSAEATGFYGVAKNVTIVPGFFSRSINPTLLSKLSRLIEKGEKEEAKRIARISVRFIFWLIPIAAIISGGSGEIVTFVFGPDYLKSGPLISLLIFAGVGLFSISNAIAIFTALDRPRLSILVTLPLVPMAVIGHFVLIPRLGAMGAAIVTLFVMGFGTVTALVTLYRTWQIAPPILTVIRSGLCAIVAGCMAFTWATSGVLLIIKMVFLLMFVPFCFWVLGEFTSEERMLIRQIIFSKLHIRTREEKRIT